MRGKTQRLGFPSTAAAWSGQWMRLTFFILLIASFSADAAKAAPLKIMAMGDSITEGVDFLTQSSGGYRDPLYHDLTAAGISFTYVGVNNNLPTPTLTAAGQTYHNGFGGWHIEDLDNNLDANVAPTAGADGNLGGYIITGGHGTGRAAIDPDILLLHVGTNDLLQETPNMNQNLYHLVTHFHSLCPNTTILIAGLIPVNNSGFIPLVQAYNSYIQNTLVPELSYTRYVDQNTSFLNANGTVNAGLLGSDTVHPDRFGYPVMALNWFRAILTVESVTPTTYPLTVNQGTGGGSYPSGTIVTLDASAPAGGSQFGSWSPATTALSNPYSAYATYTTTAAAASVSANYVPTGSPVISNGTYEIASPYDNLVIAAPAASDGSPAQQQTYTGASTQQWDLTNLGGNVVKLLMTGTNEALEVPAASINNLLANLDVSYYSGATNQQWTVSVLPGTLQLVNVASGLAINIAGYSTSSGTALVQYTPGYIVNQVWNFFPLKAAATPYTLTVNSGTGSGSYTAGSQVTVTANPPAAGCTFAGWTGATSSLANYMAATTTVTMPSSSITITATYSAIVNNPTLTVVNGSGSGAYSAGSQITVSANAPASGYQFAGWTGATGSLANSMAATTMVTMPSSSITITATYSPVVTTAALTVVNGSGSGSYSAGTQVTVTANAPMSGYQFAGWTGATSALANASASTTTLTMPSTATTITATYSQVPYQPGPSAGPAGTIVSVQFVGGGASPLHGPYFDYTAGAGQFAAPHWNPVLNIPNTTTPQNLNVTSGLTDSTGAASAVGFTLHASGAYYTGAGTGFTSTPPYPGYPGQSSGPGDAFLYHGFAYTGYSDSNPATLTVSGLNASQTYSLLLYFAPFEYFGNTQNAGIKINGATYSIATNGTVGTYQQSTSASQPGNYIEIDNLSGATSQTLTFTTSSVMVGISGFQIVTSAGNTNPQPAALTVVNGTGSGTYTAGSTVPISANAPPSGYQFAGWTGATSAIANTGSATTTLTMPSNAITVTATYTQVPQPTSGAPVSIVGVQFVGGGAAPLHGSFFDYTAGAGAFAAGSWNPVLSTGNTMTAQNLTVTSGLLNSAGATSSIGFQLGSSGAYYTGAGTGFTTSPPYPGYPGRLSGAGDEFLYAGFAYAGYSNKNPLTLTVTGLLPGEKYSLLVYITPFENFGDSQSATITLSSGATTYVKTLGKGGSYQQASSSNPSAPATGNYVEFDNLSGSTTQSLTFTNTSSLVGISGFQIADMGSAGSH